MEALLPHWRSKLPPRLLLVPRPPDQHLLRLKRRFVAERRARGDAVAEVHERLALRPRHLHEAEHVANPGGEPAVGGIVEAVDGAPRPRGLVADPDRHEAAARGVVVIGYLARRGARERELHRVRLGVELAWRPLARALPLFMPRVVEREPLGVDARTPDDGPERPRDAERAALAPARGEA